MSRRCVFGAALVLATAACSSGGEPSTGDAATTGSPATPVTEVTAPIGTEPAAAPTTTAPAATAPAATAAPGGVRPVGFTTATVRITGVDGEVCDVCMWLADVADERTRGLMGVTDLGEPVGMAFVFEQPVEGAFFMFGTPTPLSIAWFDDGGAYVSSTDMAPCQAAESADCERYRADGPYTLAIEVVEGGLGDLGIEAGATAEVLAGTESPTCAAAAG